MERVLETCTLFISAILADSVMPTMDSGEMSLIKGNSLSNAIVAANAVLPLPAGPCTNTLTTGVRSDSRT